MTYDALDLANLSRSLNEALILSALAQGPRHGYQLVQEIAQASGGDIRFKHGTLYPILHRLELAGLIAGSWSDEGPRGKRRAYVLTDEGRGHLSALRCEWQQLTAQLARSFGEGR
jgi:PadR family transcriptional regulator PadR